MEDNKIYDCSRACTVERTDDNELLINYSLGCSKLAAYNWLTGINSASCKDLFEVRFKNTHKGIYRNTSGLILKIGDIVVVEATYGHDVGIITLEGPIVARQMVRHHIDPATYEFKKIYRKAKILDIERWQEAIAREHKTMIRSRQIAEKLGLSMKIGDVEFQGDGTKAIFYYIAVERVDFRQLIKDFAAEFGIRIEMKQIGARQEAGLIGGIGVCGRPLCCSCYMADFSSINTQAARCQELSLNPQKLAGQCSKLKCCINYEASTYLDARSKFPIVKDPLEFKDGSAWLVKTDILGGIMWFSYEKNSLTNIFPLNIDQVRKVQAINRKGGKPDSLQSINSAAEEKETETDFVSAAGDESITRFDESKLKNNRRRKGRRNNGQREEK